MSQDKKENLMISMNKHKVLIYKMYLRKPKQIKALQITKIIMEDRCIYLLNNNNL